MADRQLLVGYMAKEPIDRAAGSWAANFNVETGFRPALIASIAKRAASGCEPLLDACRRWSAFVACAGAARDGDRALHPARRMIGGQRKSSHDWACRTSFLMCQR